MNTVKGKNIIISMLQDGVYYPVFCAKSLVLTQEQEVIEITSIVSGNDREYEPGLTSTTLEVSGITILDNSALRISILYLMQITHRRETHTMKITLTDDDGNSKDVGFNAIITTNSFTKDLGGAFSQSSVSMIVTGAITITDTINPPSPSEVQDTLYITGVEGATSVSHSLLEATGVEIIEVTRSGLSYVQTGGTPGNFQFKFTGGAGNGKVDFYTGMPFNSGEVVSVIYKKPI